MARNIGGNVKSFPPFQVRGNGKIVIANDLLQSKYSGIYFNKSFQNKIALLGLLINLVKNKTFSQFVLKDFKAKIEPATCHNGAFIIYSYSHLHW